MKNDDFEYDLEAIRKVVDKDKAVELWSKAEIAKILMNQATRLLEEIKTDVNFYSMVSKIEQD